MAKKKPAKKKPAKKKTARKKPAKKKTASKQSVRSRDQLRQEYWFKVIVVALLGLIVLVIVGSLMTLVYAWWYDNRQVPSAETVQAVVSVEAESLSEPEEKIGG